MGTGPLNEIVVPSAGGPPMSTAQEAGLALREARTGMPNFLPFAVFAVLLMVSLALAVFVGTFAPVLGGSVGAAGIVLSALVATSTKVPNQWEAGYCVAARQFSRHSGTRLIFHYSNPRAGLHHPHACANGTHSPPRSVITRDNVPVAMTGVLFQGGEGRGRGHEGARLFCMPSANWPAQTALRDVVGGMTLDEVLAERERIGKMIQDVVEKDAQAWALEVTASASRTSTCRKN